MTFLSFRFDRGGKKVQKPCGLYYSMETFSPIQTQSKNFKNQRRIFFVWEILCFAMLLLVKQKWHGSSDRLSWSLFKAWLAFTRFALVRLVPPPWLSSGGCTSVEGVVNCPDILHNKLSVIDGVFLVNTPPLPAWQVVHGLGWHIKRNGLVYHLLTCQCA